MAEVVQICRKCQDYRRQRQDVEAAEQEMLQAIERFLDITGIAAKELVATKLRTDCVRRGEGV